VEAPVGAFERLGFAVGVAVGLVGSVRPELEGGAVALGVDADRVPVPGPLWVFDVDVGGGLGPDAVAGGVFEVALEAAFAGLVVGGDDLGGDERLLHLVQG